MMGRVERICRKRVSGIDLVMDNFALGTLCCTFWCSPDEGIC